MKQLCILVLLFSFLFIRAQSNKLDSLKQVFKYSSVDTTRIYTLLRIGIIYFYSKPDSAYYYVSEALTLAKEKKVPKGESQSLSMLGNLLFEKGDYVQALTLQFKALEIQEKRKDSAGIAATYNNMAMVYQEQEDYPSAVNYFSKAKDLLKAKKRNEDLVKAYLNIGFNYEKMNRLDSALFYQEKAYDLAQQINDDEDKAPILTNLGNIYYKLHNAGFALQQYRSGIPFAQQFNDQQAIADAKYGIAKLLQEKGLIDSSIVYAKASLTAAAESSYPKGIVSAAGILSALYEKRGKIDSAYLYYKKAATTQDTLFNAAVVRKVQVMTTNDQLRRKEIEEAKAQYLNKIKFIALLVGLGIFLLMALILYRNNQQKQNANRLLQSKNEEVESTLSALKATQAQLIQSEKMASLGELTAGIAHEIQNPLNFVNNFSEVSTELCMELDEEINNPVVDKEAAKSIIGDLSDNLQKINHHGKRADAIVKSMLEHSRTSKGEKQLIDINALADEYMRLAYHGFRTKDKGFTCNLETHYDLTAEKINIIPQEVGRVLLNLFHNAFYSLQQKKLRLNETFEPIVTVSTKKEGHKIAISVNDNGIGIPQKVVDKIFQPFFTTKPTGEGTGLGLSLSYDIIKTHGGELKVVSKEGEGATFIVELPL